MLVFGGMQLTVIDTGPPAEPDPDGCAPSAVGSPEPHADAARTRALASSGPRSLRHPDLVMELTLLLGGGQE
ncbi:hypothetical protein GCM10018953_57390 [Streptosporangium nondiastaticum]